MENIPILRRKPRGGDIILKFSKKSMLILILLIFSGIAVQPVYGNDNSVAREAPIEKTADSVVIDSKTVDSSRNTNSKVDSKTSTMITGSDINSPQSNYNKDLQGISADNEFSGSIYESDLPDYLYTMEDFSAMYSDSLKSPYMRLYQDALVKVDEFDQLETVVKVDSFGLTPEMALLFDSYHVTILNEYPVLSVYKVSLDARLLDSFVNEARQISGVSYVQPSYYYGASFIPNDPEYFNQYGPQIIGMEYTWDIQMGNNSLLVAVIDTGIDYNHPDLGNYVPIGYDWVNNDDDPLDDHGHGTHVAGTIAATINNGIGIAGVADVSFFAEKFLDEFGFGSDIDGANAIMHAVDAGAQILSNSWGGYGESQVLEDAVNYAVANGVIVVAAAGNGATSSPHYPAAYPDVISVSATDSGDNFAGFSNFGDWIDIAAPGVNILSTVPWGYDYFSGTSMATPHVSGLLAILMSQFPDYTPSQIENLLYSSAVDLGTPGFDPYFGWGRIDAALAIEGLQEFNVRASLMAPSIVPFDQPSLFTAGVSNLGFADVTDVSFDLRIDGVSVLSGVIPYLESGNATYFDYVYFPPGIGTYELNLTVSPVPGETVLWDNEVLKTVEASAPIINPSVGDEIAYGVPNGELPFILKWVIVDTSDPLANIMDLWFYDEQSNQEWWADTFTLNTYTREYSSIYFEESGILFPYWVQTDLQIGETFDLFQVGAQDAYVVDEVIVDYYGVPVFAFLVDDGFEFVLFTQTDGVLIQLRDYNFNPIIYDLIYTSAVTEADSLINLRTAFVGSVGLVEGQPSIIEVLVQNTGNGFQDVFLDFYVNGEFIDSIGTLLDYGGYMYISFQYTAPVLGEYFLEIIVEPVFDEFYLDDNFDSRLINVIDLENYGLSYPSFSWYDAAANGFNLGLFGDDVSTPISFPFMFEYYDQVFDTVFISSNGWMSFVDSDPWEYWFPGFPNEDYPYSVALFWDDLIAEGNVYAWVTSDFVVIEYNNYNYLWGDLAGTFEVVFFATGEILFQYQFVNYENFVGKGLNYGINIGFYTLLPINLGGVTNFAALFSRGEVSQGPDIEVGLNIPSSLEPGMPVWIQAYAQNIGGSTAEYVNINLFINGEWVGFLTERALQPNEVLTFDYLWIPEYEGQVEITVTSYPVEGETNTNNNQLTEYVLVGGYHDLSVFLDIFAISETEFQVFVFLDNYGQTAEANVELFLLVNGELVTAGRTDLLDTGEYMELVYLLTGVEGLTEVTAYTPIRVNDDVPENNVQTVYIEPLVPDARVEIFVLAGDTMQPLVGASVFLGGQSIFYDGFTNETGIFSLDVVSGEYFLGVFYPGYVQSEDFIFVNPGETLFYEVILQPLTGEETVQFFVEVWDAVTLAPLAGVEVYIEGNGSIEIGYTDEFGMYETELQLGEYYVAVFLEGYYPQDAFVLLDNPNYGYGVGFELVPETSQPFELLILSPTEGEVIEGGLVEVFFDATPGLVFIDVYVNGLYITTVDYLVSGSLFVPVFADGFNLIELVGGWNSGATAYDSVEILSVNLQPYMVPEIGDHYYFQFTINIDPLLVIDFEFVFIGYVSPDEVVLNLTYFIYEDGDLVDMQAFYLIVNLLNGYVVESDMWWLHQHFYPLSGLMDPANAQIGDTFPFWTWGNKLTIVGSGDWNGIETWEFTDFFGANTGGVAKANGLFLWYNIDNFELGEVTSTSLLPDNDSIPPPVVLDTPNMTTELNSTGNTISWVATSESPDNYSILLDGWQIQTGTWTSGEEISINIDGLPLGVYEFQFAVQDTEGQTAFDFVYVTVVDTTAPVASTEGNVTYNFGSTGNFIVIDVFDVDPSNYTVFRDWEFVESEFWTNEVPIEINIDGLSPGLYEYYIFIADMSGNAAELWVLVEVIDVTPPTVRSLPDFSYEVGSEDNYITWTVSGDPEGMYVILFDDELLESGSWVDGDTIEINVDGLETGRYNFTAIFEDMNGNSEVNTVLVYVIEDTLPPGLSRLPGFQIWMALVSLLVAIPVIKKRRAQA